MNKEKNNQKLEGNEKQPLMSKGMIIALIITIVVVATTVTTVILVTSSKQDKEIQKGAVVTQSKPFDYDKQDDNNYYCDCCFEDECYYCDCGDCEDCYCDDCECCWGDDCYYDDECYDDCEDKDHKAEDYSGEEILSVSNNDIYEITSSSDFNENGIDYSAGNLIDGTLEDAWIEGAEDVGVGQSVYIHLENSRKISGVKINAGYQRSSSMYYGTSRPRSLLIEFSSGKSAKFELDDSMTTQSFTLDNPVIAKGIKITIESIYEGTDFSNTAISEIDLF